MIRTGHPFGGSNHAGRGAVVGRACAMPWTPVMTWWKARGETWANKWDAASCRSRISPRKLRRHTDGSTVFVLSA